MQSFGRAGRYQSDVGGVGRNTAALSIEFPGTRKIWRLRASDGDKLIAIVSGETNVNVRRRAISALASSDDPRAKEALKDIVTR